LFTFFVFLVEFQCYCGGGGGGVVVGSGGGGGGREKIGGIVT
jgi:hypothetical protein